MGLDEQLAELLARLGVVLEDAPERESQTEQDARDDREGCEERGSAGAASTRARFSYGRRAREAQAEDDGAAERQASIEAPAELSLFQTSREHYGVFYRLDLVGGSPQLRIFVPDESGALKMGCFLVRPAAGSPLDAWFLTTREHRGSASYDDVRDTAQQHLLFAAGELMKRLFWSGDTGEVRFPAEIEVRRLA
jgi:hypothetical protein